MLLRAWPPLQSPCHAAQLLLQRLACILLQALLCRLLPAETVLLVCDANTRCALMRPWHLVAQTQLLQLVCLLLDMLLVQLALC